MNYSSSNIYSYGSYANAYFYSEGTYSVSVRANNTCGWSSWSYLQPIWAYYYSPSPAFPTPASDVLNIELVQTEDAKANGKNLTYDVRLYDGYGNLLLQEFSKGGTVEFNVSKLPVGIYYLHIYDGVNEKPAIHQIMVEH